MLVEAFFRTFFLQAFDFSGRSTRTWTYLYGFFNTICMIVLLFISQNALETLFSTLIILFTSETFEVSNIFDILDFIKLTLIGLSIFSAISIIVRRLHDIDKSGWFVFLFFIPVIGQFFPIMFLFPGTDGRNRFGPDPRLISRFK